MYLYQRASRRRTQLSQSQSQNQNQSQSQSRISDLIWSGLVCRCPVPVWSRWPDSARPLSRKSLEMARCRRRWSDFWQTPGPLPACDTPMAWNYPAMIGRLPRCLRRGLSLSQKKKSRLRDKGAEGRDHPPLLSPAASAQNRVGPVLLPCCPPGRYLPQLLCATYYCMYVPYLLQLKNHPSICPHPLAACQTPLVYAAWYTQGAESAHSQVTSREPQQASRTSS